MTELREYLIEFFEKDGFPTESRAALLGAYDKLSEKSDHYLKLTELLARYDSNTEMDYTVFNKDVAALAEDAGIEKYTLYLLIYSAMSRSLRQRYIERGVDLSIFDKSMEDLRYKLLECIEVYGIHGSFVAPWFSGFFRMKLFGLLRLQFEIVRLGMDAVVDGVSLTEDTEVINVHIPRTGGRLDHDEVLASYKMASEFFADRFKDRPIVFHCSSWLLWKEHSNMLPSESNIRKFMSDYTIIKEREYEDYNELWRLFDKRYEGDPDLLPADSTLRRRYIEHIKSGKPTGSAKGAFIYK